MSIDVMVKVIQRAPVSGSAFTCMLIMASWCNDDGDSLFPSVDLLAEAMRVSRSQAKRVLRKLMPKKDDEAAGWWVRVVGNDKGGAPGMTRHYELNVARLDTFPLLPEFEKAAERRQKKGQTGRTHAPRITRSTGRTHAPPINHETGRTHAPPRGAPVRPDSSEDSSVEKGAHAMSDLKAFDRALKAWPSGAVDSRKDALKAWRALSLEDRLEASCEIGRFVLTNKSAGRTMICGFANYLGERKWKALPERPKPASSGPARSAVKQPTKFQLSKPHLYPEIFGDQAIAPSEVAKP